MMPLPDPCVGVDIDAKLFRNPHLEKIGHVAASLQPQPMRHAIRLQRLKSLEEHQRLQESVAGRVTVIDRCDIGPRRQSQRFVIGIGRIANFADQLFRHLARGQLQRRPIRQRVFDRVMVQDAGMNQPAQKRFFLDGVLGLGPDLVPDRIKFGKMCLRLGHIRGPPVDLSIADKPDWQNAKL